MGEIALGQYYPSNSILHRLDPRVKILWTLVYIVSVFLVKGVYGYVYCAAVLAALIILSKVPFRFILKSMKPILFILIVTMLFNIFLTPGEEIARWWIFRVTREGMVHAVRMAIRLSFLVMGSSIMTLTTTPNALTDGMERQLGFLKVLHVPVHEISMMMSIALRFIPILMEETDKIRKAQMARGADFESGGFIRRMRSMIPLLVPLFVSAFRRANDLAMAMEARCYHGGAGRTQMKPLRYAPRDFAAYGIMAAFLAGIVFFSLTGL
ncbi:MAG: energy-coupling factor transporter transmembrane protein EcfT [Lachnospiraceae bacterium]|nr:energy-coupling factor transporter transmembrane protein EcfT [Lachnospiraceae bacterium]